MSLADIAKKFKVARTTVSVCLNHREKQYKIRAELAEAIREYAREIGYMPNHAAARMRRGTSGNAPVGIIFALRNDMPKFNEPMRQIIDYLNAKQREYMLIGLSGNSLGEIMTVFHSMGIRDVIVLMTVHEAGNRKFGGEDGRLFMQDWNIVKNLLEAGMHLYIPDYAFPLPDGALTKNIFRAGFNRQKMRNEVLQRMKNSGYAPIALSSWLNNEKDLIPEYLEDEEMILPNQFSTYPMQEGMELAKYVVGLRKRRPLRSVFLSNDYVAGGLLKGLQQEGIRIPEDIAVISFGDYDVSPFFASSLTTVASSAADIALQMVKSICGDAPGFPVNTELQYRICERESLRFHDQLKKKRKHMF